MAAPYISAGSRVAFSRESTFGTKVSPATFFGITNEDIEFPDLELDVKQYHSFGAGRRWFSQKAGRRQFHGSLPIIVTNAQILYYAFGAETFVAGSPNVHVLDPVPGALMPSLTWGGALVGQGGSNDFLRNFVGTSFPGFSASAPETGELTFNFDTYSIDVEDEQTSVPSLFTQPSGSGQTPYMFYDRDANISIGGTYDFSSAYTSGYQARYSSGRTWSRVKSFNFGLQHELKEQYYYRSTNAQNPAEYTTSYPTFDLTLQLVPAGKLSGDTDSVYDLLMAESAFDVLIPFRKGATTERLDFAFDNCIIKKASHGFSADGHERIVDVVLSPETFRAIAYDSIASYATI